MKTKAVSLVLLGIDLGILGKFSACQSFKIWSQVKLPYDKGDWVHVFWL